MFSSSDEDEAAYVSSFLVKTCEVRPQPNWNKFLSVAKVLEEYFDHSGNVATQYGIKTPSGSASEFYIEPMLPLIGDIDIMCYNTRDCLVVPQGFEGAPNMHLPAEFRNTDELTLCVSVNGEFPCYVFLQKIGKLYKCRNGQGFTFVPLVSNMNHFLTLQMSDKHERHGPAALCEALTRTWLEIDGRLCVDEVIPVDFVQCFRCLEWPQQAAKWLTRRRKQGFPNAATVRSVASNGCDFVATAHWKRKIDTCAKELPFRISFSRAETLLLNNWTPTQQIAYHLLRHVRKAIGFDKVSKYSSSELVQDRKSVV